MGKIYDLFENCENLYDSDFIYSYLLKEEYLYFLGWFCFFLDGKVLLFCFVCFFEL